MLGGGPHGGFRQMAKTEEGNATNVLRAALHFVAYMHPYWNWLLFIALLVLISTAMRLAEPYLLGLAVDKFIVAGDKAGLTRTMFMLLATYLVNWGATSGQFYLMLYVGQKVMFKMRQELFSHLQSLSLRYFDQHEAGDLMSRLVNDIDTISQVLHGGLVRLAGDALTLVGIIVAMIGMSSRLALASYTVIPVMLVVTQLFSRHALRAFRRTRETMGQVSAELQENISAVREVQAFSREEQNQARFADVSAADRDANVRAVTITSAFRPTLDVLSTTAIAIVAGYGAYLVLRGDVTVGVIVAFIQYTRRFYQPIQGVAQLYAQFQAALAGAERIFELLDTKPDLVDAADAVEMPPIRGKVEFDRVSFAYKRNEPVLNDVSLTAEPGATIAIVGPTGAGKTTIINLLGRFYDPDAGAVRVDGYNLRRVASSSLRRQLGIVLQDTFLFSDTIANNIRYGRTDATAAEVEAAARLVNAHNFITRQPDGYQTVLTERGSNLSQGQRQLLSFARAVLAAPRILILDEATSSVDTRTEILIQQALGQLLAGRTSFVIAHRLSTIRNADAVLFVQDGKIIERGTHDSLMAARGAYYDLYMSQFKRQETE